MSGATRKEFDVGNVHGCCLNCDHSGIGQVVKLGLHRYPAELWPNQDFWNCEKCGVFLPVHLIEARNVYTITEWRWLYQADLELTNELWADRICIEWDTERLSQLVKIYKTWPYVEGFDELDQQPTEEDAILILQNLLRSKNLRQAERFVKRCFAMDHLSHLAGEADDSLLRMSKQFSTLSFLAVLMSRDFCAATCWFNPIASTEQLLEKILKEDEEDYDAKLSHLLLNARPQVNKPIITPEIVVAIAALQMQYGDVAAGNKTIESLTPSLDEKGKLELATILRKYIAVGVISPASLDQFAIKLSAEEAAKKNSK